MNKITKEMGNSHADLYEILTQDGEIIYDEHRKGSTFFRQIVQELTEDICKEWDIPLEYIGLWKSQQFVWSEDFVDEEDMFPFVRVIKQVEEVVVKQVNYKEVE